MATVTIAKLTEKLIFEFLSEDNSVFLCNPSYDVDILHVRSGTY